MGIMFCIFILRFGDDQLWLTGATNSVFDPGSKIPRYATANATSDVERFVCFYLYLHPFVGLW